jgi:hypothetical protein
MTQKTTSAKGKSKIPAQPEERLPHELLYIPILKGKAGELGALFKTYNEVKSKIMPLIEVPEIPWDFVNDRPAKGATDHVTAFLDKLIDSWNAYYPIIIDTSLMDNQKMEDDRMIIDFLLSALHERNIQAIPCIGLDYTDEYAGAISAHVTTINRLCLRINFEDIENGNLAEDVARIIQRFKIKLNNIDLVLDFADIPPGEERIYAAIARTCINSIPDIKAYKSLTIAMTSFPENLSEHGADTMLETPRTEWQVWKMLNASKIARIPTFGDYGISSTVMQSIDPRIMKMSANIRYTHNESWVIVKGRNVRAHGFEQFFALALRLVNSEYFSGENYSWGDENIFEKSRNQGGSGNATTWREIGTNHHIAMVATQLIASIRGVS